MKLASGNALVIDEDSAIAIERFNPPVFAFPRDAAMMMRNGSALQDDRVASNTANIDRPISRKDQLLADTIRAFADDESARTGDRAFDPACRDQSEGSLAVGAFDRLAHGVIRDLDRPPATAQDLHHYVGPPVEPYPRAAVEMYQIA